MVKTGTDPTLSTVGLNLEFTQLCGLIISDDLYNENIDYNIMSLLTKMSKKYINIELAVFAF